MCRRLFAVILLLLLSGCTLTPDYERPDLDVPEAYVQPADDGASIANLEWWNLFSDTQLQYLIRTALAENRDLRASLQRIREARAFLTFTRADQYPFIDGSASVSRERPSKILFPGSETSNNYSLSADLSFEVDLWGKLRRATQAAQSDLLATEAAYRTVTISLVANVASVYFLLRDLDGRLQISRDTVKSRTESLKIIQARFDKGTVPELDVNQAEIEEADSAATLAALNRQRIQTENLLSILVGRHPGPILRNRSLNDQTLLKAIEDAGYTEPTPIQEQHRSRYIWWRTKKAAACWAPKWSVRKGC